MAKSRPIITTDVPGCRETVVDGLNGYLVPPRNSIKASEAMINLVDRNKQIFMGTKSRSIAEEKFDVRKVNEVILKEVLNKT
jgi:glycosyltransferase involved in cell wall biosynthesis